MSLSVRLTIENVASLTSGDPVVKELDGHGLVIGRAGHVDWTLPDPQALISSVHCEIDFNEGAYWLTDRSTNGTFVNGGGERLQAPWRINDGDLFSIGHYTVRATVAGGGGGFGGFGGSAAAVPAASNVWGQLDATPDQATATDAFGLAKRKALFSTGDEPVEEAFRQPEAISRQADVFGLGGPAGGPAGYGHDGGTAAPAAGSDIFGLGSGMTTAPAAAVAPAWAAAPVSAEPVAASIWSNITQAAPTDFTVPPPPPPVAVPVAVVPGMVPPVAAATAPAAAGDGALFARFLAGAGIKPRDVEDVSPGAVLAAAGELLRQTADGLIQLLYARAKLRNQFGVGAEVTTFQRAGNNPLKWTRSPEEALRQIVGKPDPGFLPGPQAVRGAFEDLQAHELALMAAMQEALKDTIQRFSPEAIRARPGRSGMLARLLPGARDAGLWQAYETEFRSLANETEAAYLDVFAKNFKKAYSRNLARVDAGGES